MCRTKLTTIFLVAVGLLAISVPLFGHQGSAAYDTDKTITVKGTVTQWFWANPHSLLKVDAKDDSGNDGALGYRRCARRKRRPRPRQAGARLCSSPGMKSLLT